MQFKACLEWHGIIKLYNWFFCFVLKHKGLQLRYWHCQAILGCLGWSTGQPQWNLKMARQDLGSSPACMSSIFSPEAIFWIFILEFSITWVNMKLSCQNHYLFQSYPKILHRLFNFQPCWMLKLTKQHKLICHNIGLSHVGMDFDKLVYVSAVIFGQSRGRRLESTHSCPQFRHFQRT